MIGMGQLPAPFDLRVEVDGAFSASWAWGKQGAPDSWRVTAIFQPGEGFIVFTTTHGANLMVHGDYAGVFLATVIDTGWGKDKRVDVSEWSDDDLEFNIRATAELLGMLDAEHTIERPGLESLHKRCVEERDRRAAQQASEEPGKK